MTDRLEKAEREWLDLRTLTEYACVSERTLRELIHRFENPLPAVQVGNKLGRRRSPKQAPPAIPVEPICGRMVCHLISIGAGLYHFVCRSSKYLFAHVRAPEPNLKVEHMDGDEFFRWLKEQVTVRQKKKASNKCPQQS